MQSPLVKKKADFTEALRFHQKSSYGFFEQVLPLDPLPYHASPEKVPEVFEKVTFGELLTRRKSSRSFAIRPIGIQDIKDIMWAAYGCIEGGTGEVRRTVPSAGGSFPLRYCLYIRNADGIDPGFYYYNQSSLQKLEGADLGPIEDYFHTQHIDYSTAACIIFIIGDFSAICDKYGERGYRYMLFEAGHSAQNICLAATALGINHIPVGGFDDTSINQTFCSALDNFSCLYTIVLGSS